MVNKEHIEDYIYKNEQWEEKELICPYCKHIHDNEDPEFLYQQRENEEFECERCGRKFILNSDFTWWYTTTPIKEEITKIIENEDSEEDC